MQSISGKRPISEIEDEENSPEYLQPVLDPYPSDDEKKRKKDNIPYSYKLPGGQKGASNSILPQDSDSSNLTSAEVLFVMDMDYMILGKEIDTSKLSTIDILKFMFEFATTECKNCTIGEDHDDFVLLVPPGVKWKNESIEDVYKRVLAKNHHLSWIAKNDTLNLKLFNRAEFDLKMDASMVELGSCEEVNCLSCWGLMEWQTFVKKLAVESRDGFQNDNVMKNLYSCVRIIGKLPSIIQNGEAQYSLTVYIPKELASDDSGVFENRRVNMSIRPDSIFTEEAAKGQKTRHKIVLEVCSTRSVTVKSDAKVERYYSPCPEIVSNEGPPFPEEKPPPKSELEQNNIKSASKKTKYCEKDEKIDFNKPKRILNGILKENYAQKTMDYLLRRVPRMLLDDHCVKKLTAKHTLQLFGLAKHIILQSMKKKTLALGMFTKNEYLFLSKLSICSDRVFQITGQLDNDHYMEMDEVPRGMISYSQFKLDLSLPNHRLALIIFLKEYLKNDC